MADINADIRTYMKAMGENNVNLALMIEERYGLDGYPPQVVMVGLQAIAEGRNAEEAILEMQF